MPQLDKGAQEACIAALETFFVPVAIICIQINVTSAPRALFFDETSFHFPTISQTVVEVA